MASRKEVESPTAKELELFKTYDKNKSGAVEVDDLRLLMADLGLLSGRSAADASSAVVATFAAADADRDGRLNEKEFAAYYRKATAPRLCDILEAEHPEDTATLRQAYANWAAFGIRKAPTPKASGGTSKRPACMDTQQLMGSAHWLKLCRDTKLVGPGRLTTTDADLIFAKVRDRGHQRVSFPQFVDALGAVAARLKVDLLEIVRQITLSEGPVMNGTTVTVPQFYVTADARASVTSLRRSSGGGSLKPLRAGTPSGDPMRDLRQSLEGKVGAKTKGSPAGSLGTPPSSGCTIPAFHHETPVSHAATPEVVAVSDAEAVLSVYAAFAGFGMGSAGHGTTPSPLKMEMDSKQFAKLAKDAALSRSSSDAVAVDLCFAKVKARGARRIGFADFLVAIALLAQEKGLEESEVLARVAACSGPRRNSTTPEYVKWHDDKTTYTGVYGRGGPVTVDKSIPDLAKLLSREPARQT